MGIVVIGATFVDIKGYPFNVYIPNGRNKGEVFHVHGGVCRNVVEDIANCELRPSFVSLVDHTSVSEDIIRVLNSHKINTKYMQKTDGGLGTWLAVFDHNGDVIASISQRPDLMPFLDVFEKYGDEIFSSCDSIIIEVDMKKEIIKEIIKYAQKYNKKIFAVVSNMAIALRRRDFIKDMSCFVCNQQEASMFFVQELDEKTPEEMVVILRDNIKNAGIKQMVVTMGSKGAVYADENGDCGIVPPQATDVVDTTGAGDGFLAGVAIGITYGKTLRESCEIGTRLASSIIATQDNVCPRFMPNELGLNVEVKDL